MKRDTCLIFDFPSLSRNKVFHNQLARSSPPFFTFTAVTSNEVFATIKSNACNKGNRDPSDDVPMEHIGRFLFPKSEYEVHAAISGESILYIAMRITALASREYELILCKWGHGVYDLFSDSSLTLSKILCTEEPS